MHFQTSIGVDKALVVQNSDKEMYKKNVLRVQSWFYAISTTKFFLSFLFFFIGACRVLAVTPLSNTSDGLRCGSAVVEQVWINKPLEGVG